jgi:hypothetical protein
MVTKKRDPELERWINKGRNLEPDRHQWDVADWILKGVEKFGKKQAYDEAEKLTGYTRATLYEFKYTAECFRTISTRVGNLSFGHHRLVAKKYYTPEQRQTLLGKAKGKSVSKFAAILRQKRKDDERKRDKRSRADRVADKITDACDAFLRTYDNNISTLETSTPSRRNCMALFDKLRKIATRISSKIEQLEKGISNDETTEQVQKMIDGMDDSPFFANIDKVTAARAGK